MQHLTCVSLGYLRRYLERPGSELNPEASCCEVKVLATALKMLAELQRWPQTSWDPQPLRCCLKQWSNLKLVIYLYTTAIVCRFTESYADLTCRCVGASFGQVSLEKVGVDISTLLLAEQRWKCGSNVLKTELSASPNYFQRKSNLHVVT